MDNPSLKSLRDRPFELLAELERRGRAVSAQVSQEGAAGREWVGVALRMAGDLYLVAREETREVLGVPTSMTRVPGAKAWIKGLMFEDSFCRSSICANSWEAA
jgi:twitching motility protein PilI